MLEALYKKHKKGRLDIFIYIVAAVFIILIVRLFFLQVVDGNYYHSKAEGNRLRVMPITAARGIMYDRNGQILVGSRPAYTVSLVPTEKGISNEELTTLAKMLKVTPDTLQKKIDAHKGGYEPIRLATDIPMDAVTTIEEHQNELPGIAIDVEPLRYYPYNTMASQLLVM